MKKDLSSYFDSISDPRVVGRCDHILSDILLVAICTYLTGGCDYQDMHLFAKERGNSLTNILDLSNGAPSADTFERVFKRLKSDALAKCLQDYGYDILSSLSVSNIYDFLHIWDKQIHQPILSQICSSNNLPRS